MIKEEKADLFELDNSWALGHCVGNDFIMGRGIATIFKEKFGHQEWLISNSKGVGTCLLLPQSDIVSQNIFYLVTKPYSKYSKPTYESITSSLHDMFKQAKEQNITKIALPRIGCGLDGKNWTTVLEIIKKEKPDDITILIRYL